MFSFRDSFTAIGESQLNESLEQRSDYSASFAART